jgi:hypothetical protein
MGTMINLALGRLEVDWGKNNGFTNHTALYQASDVKPVPSYYAGDDWPNGEPIIEFNEGLSKPLRHVVDRIELLGFTLKAVEEQYRELHVLHELHEQPIPFQRLATALKEVDVTQVSGQYGEDYDPGKFVRREILDRLALASEVDRTGLRPDHWEVDTLLESFSPYGALRLLAENPQNANLEVTWDYGPLVEAGWAKLESFKPGPTPEQCFLLVTEGSSDAKIIAHAFRLLRPHIADFFRFVDMEEGYPFSGTGNLFRFTQGLVSIGILNNVVVIYDNDAEGVAKSAATRRLSLPANFRVMRLPYLTAFEHFPTQGPTGPAALDVNGKAASIECYLDLTQPGLPAPIVHWSAFNHESQVYQGALEHKGQFLKHFLDLRQIPVGYDASKLEAVLDAIVAECVGIAEHKNIARSEADERQ